MNLENLNNRQSNSDDISIKEVLFKARGWFRYLVSKWLVVLSFSLLGGALGFLYAFSKNIIYTASTTFVLEDGAGSGGALGQYAGLASMAGIELGSGGGGIFQGDNILELYKSRKMIQKTLLTEVEYNGKSQLLIDRYISFNKLREKWAEKPELNDIQFKDAKSLKTNFSRLQDSILGTIIIDINKNYLNVYKPDKKLSIIRADVKAKDEFFAKTFDDEIVKNVNDFYVQTKTKKSIENVTILQQKTDSVRAVMNGAIYSAAIVSDATPNLNPTRQVQRVAPVQRSQFTAETNRAVLVELVKNLEMSKIGLRKEVPLIQVVDQPVLPLEREKLGKIKGVIVGGFIFGFLTVLFMSFKLIFKNILSSE